MEVTAAMVKDLRDRTGAGMMDAKKALVECNGNTEEAIDWLRAKGMAKAEKKAGRVASEGMVYALSAGTKGVMVEVNSETDFVAKNENFVAFVKGLGAQLMTNDLTDVEEIKASTWSEGGTVGEKILSLVATIGENINLRRVARLEVTSGTVASYIHMNGKIGVLLGMSASQSTDKLAETAKNVAMHVAAFNPMFLDRNSVDETTLQRERAIYTEQARQGGKPDSIVEKIVEGRVSKFCEEVCLVDQAFFITPDQKVGQVVAEAASDAKITSFVRFARGEGIEKEETDFAAEVAAAVAV